VRAVSRTPLSPPTVIDVLTDIDLFSDFRNALSLANQHISLSELGHDLGTTVFLHERALSKTYYYCRLPSPEDWINIWGAGHMKFEVAFDP
jgi:hypothetical protein